MGAPAGAGLTMIYQDIRVERDGGVGWIVFNRPAVNNAVRVQTMAELCAGLDELIKDEAVRAIVLRGEGKHFIAGAEFSFLHQLRALSAAEIQQQIYEHFQGAARRLYTCPKPTVAAVSGACITVGCELALCCDFRLATPSAIFQEIWIRLGLLPPLGGMKLLPMLVGLGRAKDMILRGTAVRGEEAAHIGLVGQLVQPEELLREAAALASELSRSAPLAYRAAKDGIARSLESSIDRESAANVTAQSLLIGSGDFAEGLAAVEAKRQPYFLGR